MLEFVKLNFADPLGRTPEEAFSKVYLHKLPDVERQVQSLARIRALRPDEQRSELRSWQAAVLATASLECLRAGILTAEEQMVVSGVAPGKKSRETLPLVRLGGGACTVIITEALSTIAAAMRLDRPCEKVVVGNDVMGALLAGIENDVDRVLVWPSKKSLDPDALTLTPSGSTVALVNTPEGILRVHRARFKQTLRRAREFGIDAGQLRGLSNDLARRMSELGSEEAVDRKIDKFSETHGMELDAVYDLADAMPLNHENGVWALLRAAFKSDEGKRN